jgi:hypothetical protein
MKKYIVLTMAVALLLTVALLRLTRRSEKDDTFIVTIEKKPKEIVTDGPVVIYRYNMTGTKDYQWIYVPTEESRTFVVSLLKALKVIKGDSGVGVHTLAEVKAKKIVPGEHQDSHDQNIARLTADLQNHAAVVDSYENPSGAR